MVEVTIIMIVIKMLTIIINVSTIIISMCHMSINLLNYLMFIIVINMSRNIVSYITCMLYVLCKQLSYLKISGLFHFSDIGIIVSVHGIMFVNYHIINQIITCIFRFEP